MLTTAMGRITVVMVGLGERSYLLACRRDYVCDCAPRPGEDLAGEESRAARAAAADRGAAARRRFARARVSPRQGAVQARTRGRLARAAGARDQQERALLLRRRLSGGGLLAVRA